MSDDEVEAIPLGIIEVDRELSDEEMEKLRTAFRAAMARPDRVAILGAPARVWTSTPRSRWQAYKQRHAGSWWLGWLVLRRPVRYHLLPVRRYRGGTPADGSGTVIAERQPHV